MLILASATSAKADAQSRMDAGAVLTGDSATELVIVNTPFRLQVTGAVSSDVHEAILRQSAASYFPEKKLHFELQQEPTAPGWSLLTDMTLRALASTKSSEARIERDIVSIKGVTEQPGEWQEALDWINRSALPDMVVESEVFAIKSNASFVERCQQQFDEAAADHDIEFPTSSSQLKPGAYAMLDELIEVAVDCPTGTIVITAHSDGSGSPAENRQISLARAEAVTAYMSERGLSQERLKAVGAGDTAPLVDAGDPDARKKNRRIELRLEF